MAKKLPKIISQVEFEKIFEAAEKKYKHASQKRKPIIKQYMLAMLLGFEAGLRISEIVGIKELKSRCCNEDIKEEVEE